MTIQCMCEQPGTTCLLHNEEIGQRIDAAARGEYGMICTTSATCPVHPDVDCPGAFDDPGPVPAGTITIPSVNAELDDLQLTDREREQLLDYLIGYSPVAVHDGLIFVRGIRARLAAAILEA